MRGRPDVSTGITSTLDPSELAAILAEVRRAILAVDVGTGEYRPLRDITLTPADGADTVAGD
jgi:hypothetical protein